MKREKVDKNSLNRGINALRIRTEVADNIFNNTTDWLLLDASIYEIKYLRAYHAYLLSLARKEATCDVSKHNESISSTHDKEVDALA